MGSKCALLLLGPLAVLAMGGCAGQTVSTAGSSPITNSQSNAFVGATAMPTPVVTVTPAPTAEPTATPASTPAPTPEPPTGLSGQAGVTKAMTVAGSLGMTLAEFVDRWNSVLDQGQYPLKGAPERSGATFSFAPDGADNTMLVGVLNDDGTVRAVDALSVAEGISDDSDRSMAQLEALTIWATLGRAVNPRLTEAEGNLILTDLGLPVGTSFGLLPPLVLDLKGVRYYIIEGDTTTNFVARPSD